MDYNRTIAFSGRSEEALNRARDFFTVHNFEIVDQTAKRVLLRSSKFGAMGGTQNPVRMISQVEIEAGLEEITLRADFDGLRRFVLYMSIFIASMAVFFIVLFGLLFALPGKMSWMKVILFSVTPLAPWPVLIPVFYHLIRSRLNDLLDVLMKNIQTAAARV